MKRLLKTSFSIDTFVGLPQGYEGGFTGVYTPYPNVLKRSYYVKLK